MTTITITNYISGEVRPDCLRCTACSEIQLKRDEDVTVILQKGQAVIKYTCRACADNETRYQMITRSDDSIDWGFRGIAKAPYREHGRERTTFRRGYELEDPDYDRPDHDQKRIDGLGSPVDTSDENASREYVTDNLSRLEAGDRIVVEAERDEKPDIFPVWVENSVNRLVKVKYPTGIDGYEYFFVKDDDESSVVALIDGTVTDVELYRVLGRP